MPLQPFNPLTDKFLYAPAYNFAARGQGSSALEISADSEAVGAEADHMEDDNCQTAYLSGALGGDIVVEVDLGENIKMDTFALAYNNLQLPNGMRFQAYSGISGTGQIFDSGVGLDCIVRDDDSVISDHAQELLDEVLNISPVRMPVIEPRGLRVTFDTAAGNGVDDFLEICFVYAGLDIDVDNCLSENAVTFERLSPTTPSIGLGGSSTPRIPGRHNDVPLSFLDSPSTAKLTTVIGTKRQHHKVFFWATPYDLSTFPASAFFAVQSPSAPGVKRFSRNTTRSEMLSLDEER